MSAYPEDAAQAWKERFGEEPPEFAEQLTNFLVHRSVRKYSDQPVSEELITALVGAAQSAATSSNLQMWSLISVQEPERREKIAKLCADQDQVHKAPWFFAFVADHHRVRRAAATVGERTEGLSYLEFLLMAVIDASLAAERMVCAAESLGLGICYIGALRDHPEEVKELLELPDGVWGVFGLCVGYPAEPSNAHIRPRLAQENVWFKERYNPTPDLSKFEERTKNFHETEGMRGDPSWSKRSGRRVDRNHLTGREVLKSWLNAQGLGLE